MATINININVTDQIKEKLIQALEDVGMTLVNEAKQEITDMGGVDTGILRASTTHKVDASDYSCTVGTNVEYAPYYHEGTGIFAKGGNGRQTPWKYKKGDKWYTTAGQKSHPYLENAFYNSESEIRKCFKGCLDK